jgi:hypothetical protein
MHVHISQGLVKQAQIDRAIEVERQVSAARKLNGSVNLHVGVRTVHDYRFNLEGFTRRAEAYRPTILKLHIRVVEY